MCLQVCDYAPNLTIIQGLYPGHGTNLSEFIWKEASFLQFTFEFVNAALNYPSTYL